MSYRTIERITAHAVDRIELESDAPFDELRRRFEAAVPPLDQGRIERLVAEGASWERFARGATADAPFDFVRFWSDTDTVGTPVGGSDARHAAYLIGEFVLAARAFRLDAGSALYTPFRLALHTSRAGGTVLGVERPSAHLASFGLKKVAEAGYELDRRLGDLIESLDLPRPSVLRS